MTQWRFAPGHHRYVILVGVGLAVAFTAIATGPSTALAAQRYAAPTPIGATDCSSPADSCSIQTAIEGAKSGDEVILAAGNYGTAGTPLSAIIQGGAPHLDVHGTDTTPGPPGVHIYTDSSSYGLSFYGPDSTIADLEIIDSASGIGGALLLEGEGELGERLLIRAGEHEGSACFLESTVTLRDSLCEAEGGNSAVRVSGTLYGPNAVTLRNVTAVALKGAGIADESNPAAGRSSAITAVNTIARGGTYDILADQDTQPATVTTSHSNYETTDVIGGATVTDDGTSQIKGDQSAAQLFVNPLSNFDENPGAQTIRAGITEEANGPLDIAGNLRTYPTYPCAPRGSEGALLTDIGAYQYVPPVPPCPPPIESRSGGVQGQASGHDQGSARTPETSITETKLNRRKRRLTLSFRATESPSGFECKLLSPRRMHRRGRGAAFSPCASPKTYKHLQQGRYRFTVRAFNAAGVDPSPPTKKVKVRRV